MFALLLVSSVLALPIDPVVPFNHLISYARDAVGGPDFLQQFIPLWGVAEGITSLTTGTNSDNCNSWPAVTTYGHIGDGTSLDHDPRFFRAESCYGAPGQLYANALNYQDVIGVVFAMYFPHTTNPDGDFFNNWAYSISWVRSLDDPAPYAVVYSTWQELDSGVLAGGGWADYPKLDHGAVSAKNRLINPVYEKVPYGIAPSDHPVTVKWPVLGWSQLTPDQRDAFNNWPFGFGDFHPRFTDGEIERLLRENFRSP